MSSSVILTAVGDVFLDRPDPEHAFDQVSSIFHAADVVFGNSEGVYAEPGRFDRAPSCGVAVISDPHNAAGLAGAGFDVMSVANNHIIDGGHSGLRRNNEVLTGQGLQITGAGDDLVAARTPAVTTVGPTSVAFLAYSSTFPSGYQARREVPGLAPLRSENLFRPYEQGEWSPGLLPQVVCSPVAGDYDDLAADIAAARESADVVIVSVHAGDFTRPYVLTDHERHTARFAIDAGADAFLGHHHHLLRGAEYHNGKPIFYGLGHFAFDLPDLGTRLAAEGYLGESSPEDSRAAQRRAGDYRLWPRDDYPLLPFHEDARMSMISILRLRPEHDAEMGVIPCMIEANGQPRPLQPDEPDGKRVLDYLQRCCDHEHLSTTVDPGAFGDIDGWRISAVVPTP